MDSTRQRAAVLLRERPDETYHIIAYHSSVICGAIKSTTIRYTVYT